MSKAQQKGQIAEDVACKHLQQRGLKLIDRNYRCRVGEIDLIMQDADSLVFVEVRYRQNSGFGNGAESVTFNKQNKLIKTAYYYLQQRKINSNINCRFDVVSITSQEQIAAVDWIKNAFSA